MRLDPLRRYVDTGGNDVHQPYTAFNQGWDAWEAGHPMDANPYAGPTREHYWWRLGWLDAKDDGGQSGAHPTVPPRGPRAAELVPA